MKKILILNSNYYKDISKNLVLSAKKKLIQLKPKRIILNPGAENPSFEKLAHKNGIEVVVACSLVMLSLRNFELKP